MLHVKQWNKWFPNGNSKKKGESQPALSSAGHGHRSSADQERRSRRDLDVPHREARHHSNNRREDRSPRPSPRPSPESSPRSSSYAINDLSLSRNISRLSPESNSRINSSPKHDQSLIRNSPRPSPESSPIIRNGPVLTRRSASPGTSAESDPRLNHESHIRLISNIPTPRATTPIPSPRPSPRPSFSLEPGSVLMPGGSFECRDTNTGIIRENTTNSIFQSEKEPNDSTRIQEDLIQMSSLKPANDNESPCCLCLEYKPDHALYPCGHLCLCALCKPLFLANIKHCLICQLPAADAIRIVEIGFVKRSAL